ncbi:MAG: 16S rRNA (cytosine(967)-C(5))-methyltransferase RsmB [Ruminococcaceae bacterium]|nr:16S rRNA (cytosine(967)-C(5))-methyltransferase RsmB [Oscillospiraceae bacterium]
MTARGAAVKALLVIQEQDGYSNIVLDELLSSVDLSATDRAFASRLLYGVTERRLTLDYLLNQTSSTPVKMMDPVIREILRVGAYQLVYMNKIPAFAAIHEAVELSRQFGRGRLSGFVNGVLRQVERQFETLLPALPTTDKGLEIRYSLPRAWIRAWRAAYGEEVLQGLLGELNEAPPSYIRVNTSLTTTAAFCRRLEEHGIAYAPVSGLPDALCVSPASALHNLPDEMALQYYFQDVASQWCCRALDAQPGERIADLCAAPGGKTMTVAQYMNNSGYVLAGDIHDHKCRGLEKRVKQYGFKAISVRQWDASVIDAPELIGAFDRVLCDVPCSGMGVIRRKPEIRYKQPEQFDALPALQLRILEQGAKMVRPGGVLQYSTCTLRPEENQAVTEAFLETHPEFLPRLLPLESCFAASGLPVSHEITLFPHIHGSDGFYVAGFVKQG